MAGSEHIVCDPDVLGGKPTIRGTRLSVEFVLGLFAEGWTEEKVLDNYPSLSPDALRAAREYAAHPS